MSDAFFEKVFGDSESGGFGSGWMSGTASVFFGLLGFGGALCLHFPALLSLPDARPIYPMAIIRGLIQGNIVLAIVLGAISGILRERKVLALTGASLGLLAAVIGGGLARRHRPRCRRDGGLPPRRQRGGRPGRP